MQAFTDQPSFIPIQNITDESNVNIPIGITGDGVPLSAMLPIPRGHDDALLAVAADLETAAPRAVR